MLIMQVVVIKLELSHSWYDRSPVLIFFKEVDMPLNISKSHSHTFRGIVLFLIIEGLLERVLFLWVMDT